MKILLVTGRLAAKLLEEISKKLPVSADVEVLPIDVAALMTPHFLKKHLKRRGDLKEYDLIMVSGMVRGDLSEIGKELGVTIVKGPRYASDIPFVVSYLLRGKINLSPIEPADLLLKTSILKKYLGEIDNKEREVEIDNLRNFMIGRSGRRLKVGTDCMPKILAEVDNVVERPLGEILSLVKYYIKSGAHIIDLGGSPSAPHPEKIMEVVKGLRSEIGRNLVLSVDSVFDEDIEAAVDAGIDMVLSIGLENSHLLNSLPEDVGIVIVPSIGQKQVEYVMNAEQVVKTLINLINDARKKGFRKILADPIIYPPVFPGIVNSLHRAIVFRKFDGDTPLLLGARNVTDLMDVDTTGVNALLASIAVELGAGVILTSEESVKSRYSVRELLKAVKMAFIAKMNKMPPKDVGLTLLLAKSKRDPKYEEVFKKHEAKVINTNEIKLPGKVERDKCGYFRIWVNHRENSIYVAHYRPNGEISCIFSGNSAVKLSAAILSKGLVGTVSHALYLGRELEKAEICLKLGKSYVQDVDVFGDKNDE